MPQVILEIPNIEENIARPVVHQVIRELATRLGMPVETRIRQLGSGKALPVVGSTMDDKHAVNRLPGDQYIEIKPDETYDENYAMSVAVTYPEHLAVFNEPKLGILMRPVYQRINVSVDVKCVATDKTTADNWVSTIKRRFSQRVVENRHSLNYTYPIPVQYMAILMELHRLREANHGYGESIGQWLANHYTILDTAVTDQAGHNPLLVIKEAQLDVLGWFDFTDSPPKVERETDSGAWSISFGYTFGYDRVESVMLRYPLMVHNQMLDNRYYDDIPLDLLTNYMQQRNVSAAAMYDATYRDTPIRSIFANPGISIPLFDDWLPSYKHAGYFTLLRIMLQVDPTSPNALLSLGLLGDWSIDPAALAYMSSNPLAITRPYESVFNIQLHRGTDYLASDKFIVSNTLDLHYAESLDERCCYHLTLSMLANVRQLSYTAILALCEHGQFTIDYLTATVPELVSSGSRQVILPDGTIRYTDLPTLLPDGTIMPRDLQRTIDKISIRPSSNINDYSWRLVNEFIVSAHRS